MFKRDNEQPVKVSFEEKKNNKEKRSLRERLSNIPLRRRVEAVLLAVVTVMASLSIDWSKLSASAASEADMQSGQSISNVFKNSTAADNAVTILNSAKISVKIPSAAKEVDYTYEVYQNLTDETNPESGEKVTQTNNSGTIKATDEKNAAGYTELTVSLSNVALLGNETAAVVFKLTSHDGYDITYGKENSSTVRYVKRNGSWIRYNTGKCVEYAPTSGTAENLAKVTLDGVPTQLALTAGESYTFPDDTISWSPEYQRTLTLSTDSPLIEKDEGDLVYPTFKVKDSIDNGGTPTIAVSGDGVTPVNVDLKIVSFALKGKETDRSVFTYKGTVFEAGDLYKAMCENEIKPVSDHFTTSYSGILLDGTPTTEPIDAGEYTMTIEGQEDSAYKGLSTTKTFTIEQATLTADMFENATVTVKNGNVKVTGGKFKDESLVQNVDFVASITATTPETDGVKYTITLKGMNNFKDDEENPVTKEYKETGEISLESVVDRVVFESTESEYNAKKQYPKVKFFKGGEDITAKFTENTHYTIVYSGIKRSTNAEVTNEDHIIDAGEYKATVVGKGIYGGSSMTTTDSYVLKPISFSTATTKVNLTESYFEYSDSLVIHPEIAEVIYTVSESEKWKLASGTDYVLKNDEYSTEIGNHNVDILGYGNYDGVATAKYNVFASLLKSATIALGGVTDGTMNAEKTAEWDYVWTHNKPFTYTGEEIRPILTAKVNGDPLSVGEGAGYMKKSSGVNNTDVTSSNSKAYFILTLPEKYAKKKIKVEFDIAAKPLPAEALKFKKSTISKDYAYGTPITLKNGTDYYVEDNENNTLTEGEEGDYTISYENNVDAGTATIIATGTGNYSGTSKKTFNINQIKVTDSRLTITIKPQKLDTSGTVVTDMTDVEITVKDGNGNKIHPFDSNDFTLSNYKYNRNSWTSSSDGTNQPQVTLTGKRNLTGSKIINFNISKEELTGLRWVLNDTSVEGVLGSPGTNVDLTATYGYFEYYAPKLPSKTISLYSGNTKFSSFLCTVEDWVTAPVNTITITGKGNYYSGEEGTYTFTYEVRKRDINDCDFAPPKGGSTSTLPTFTLSYGGKDLTENTDYKVTAVDGKAVTEGDTYTLGEHTVTFEGIGSYAGTRTDDFLIGTPFDSDHVFVTMYGPVGTKAVKNSEDKLTYFGNNDPIFVLTSSNTDATSTLIGPSYTKGEYGEDGDYNISFNLDKETRHKVGSTVTVTFKAKEEGDTWYNPIDSNGVSNGVTYTYKVVPGSAGSDSNYGSLAEGLSIYKYKKPDGGVPQIDGMEPFPTKGTTYGGVISFPDTKFKYKYTTVETDPEIYISYDPSKVAKKCATQSTSGGEPALPDSVSYADPVEAKFNDSSLFTVNRGLISANDDPKSITMYPVSGGWIASPNIQVKYKFENALLSDAEFAFSPAEYTYTGAPANVSYSVTLGGSKLTKDPKDPDFVETGYYAYPDSGDVKTAIDAALADKTQIATKLSSFGDNLGTTAPTKAGQYVLVIGKATNGHYDGYNIAKFSIVTATFEAALKEPDTFSVKYGDTSKNAPAGGSDENNPGDLVVTGVGGKLLYLKENTSKDDGYYIDVETASPKPGINSGVANIKGTGNYAGCTRQVKYKVVADISSGKNPNFNETNLSLLDKHNVVGGTEALELRLKNDGGLPFIVNTTTRFDPDTLTLGDGNVTLDSSDLKVIVSGEGSESGDSLTTVGKKKITIEAASSKAPVTGSREYYVEVFGDISTADVTLKADKTIIKDGIIPYTGDSISVIPELDFRGDRLDVGTHYTNSDVTTSFSTIGNHSMTLKGIRETETSGKYYKGTKIVPFSIEYDLKNGAGIYYIEDDGSPVSLSKKSFDYTGSPIGPTISGKIEVRLTKNSVKVNEAAYTLYIANDTYPGANKASATISPVSGKSFNTQTVYFSIGGNKLTPTNSTITLDPKPEDDPDFYKYDGTAKTPKVSVSFTDKDGYSRTLEQGTDYSVTYKDNINVTDKATVIVTGINARYTGTISESFAITKKSLNDSDVTVEVSDVPFGGYANGKRIVIEPTVKVTIGGKELNLKKGTDYEIVYPGDKTTADQYLIKDAGEHYNVTIKGIGNYTGEVKKDDVEQLAGDLKNARIDPSLLKSPYDGTNQKDTILSKLVVKNGECTLVRGTDYEVTVPDSIINAGTYPITISATEGDYKGTSNTFTYEVTQRSIEELEVTLYDPDTGSIVSESSNFKWTGSKIEPAVKLEDKGLKPDAGVAKAWTNKDGQAMVGFEVTYGTNTNAGSKEDKAGVVTLTASAGGNYTGTLTRYFAIGQDIANASITYDKYKADYDGTPKIPKITVKCNGKILEAGTAYEDTIEFEWAGGKTNAPEKVGSYTPVIVGKPDGGYYGELKGTPPFMITATNKTGDIRITFNGRQGEVEAADYVCHYNGSKQEPSINVYDISSGLKLTRNIDYTVTYGNNTNVGSAYVYVWLEGNYTGSAKEIFFIEPYDISNLTPVITEGDNGVIKNVPESKFPYVPIFKLVGTDDNGRPFEISYGTSAYKPYLIVPDSSKVKKPGKGSLTVSGQGNLFGTTNACEYEVYGRLSESNVSVKAPIYTGTKKDPEVTVTFAKEKLVLDTDYSLRVIPFDQTATGGGNVVVTGLGYFSGSVYLTYGESGDVSSLTLRGFSQQYVYSGRFAGPAESAVYAADSEGNQVIPADKLECTFTSSVDKAACVSANATVTITSKATLDDGTVVAGPSATYKIVQRNISSCDIKQLTSDIYTGKALTPPISVSYDRKTYSGTVATGSDVIALVSGRDYSLSYSNNVNPGTAVVTVTGKGNYTGTKRFMFTIKVADMATVTARQSSEGTIVSWTARPHVTGYRVLYNTNGMTKEETSRTTMTLRDAVPTVVGVQAYVKDSAGNITYGTPKYVAVTR